MVNADYLPSARILKRYSQVLIDFALGSGQGIKKNDVILLQYDQPAKPLAMAVYQRILEKGAHSVVRQHEEDFDKVFYHQASKSQLQFFPKQYSRALVKTIDHRLYLIADEDPLYLKEISPTKIALVNAAKKPLKQWLTDKEDQGKLTWTLALYGTAGMAKQAGLTIGQYWQQIKKACYLNEDEPMAKWQQIFDQTKRIITKLNQLPIGKIRVLAKNTDLTYVLGDKRAWIGGSGRNIPSFEIFTSPDWRGTNGHIYFDFPLYRYGNVIDGIYLEFKNGKVIKARANKNQTLLEQIIKQKNADRVGEFSLTDKRFSQINKFMANTLYDENFGGRFGNTHLALGSSYHDCFRGNPKTMKTADWNKLGYNDSAEHTDIIAKQDRRVEAILKNGQTKIIYQHGSFLL
ncbi:hypothetical protein A2313_00325 [Candidatus Roizmanbacteria bacterium RIFOXYB2_FULL_41_10]|uniref:Thermophilic metalloprotease (M29) superfamily n=1 Tax=Candidatus Roizmanbacteria bacterium RIFOXYA1_FULL_41_12 TaxID=1802082 RepID=A0A1F7KAM1_9BACT|nr:MAG: hypothetical protein A2209_04395 [Candidatus Roizmanbacteria bacterium RIFOXYA1_FULL_41_12]OGK66831.1 MAG: hypothetical protein A2377_02930 [Candidatus Roizmanbacteria bacterium RIFOXYB1_FULL_41_27]OGK70795.1 MAG: hypothetical protein A2403_01775 [Candidatus Roizmanbacteria bacterium RIFOXYC1_FULL_41_16]OGK71413.1 MAG: hypothetical protein A2313_00325 [Candidatus Roizmanbacteria bacterium RIFOXYB2_FULL_41_10]OGK75626.1 MAG: hypothetical protein A2575_02925 [Candidatus Roizmanbacteria ba